MKLSKEIIYTKKFTKIDLFKDYILVRISIVRDL